MQLEYECIFIEMNINTYWANTNSCEEEECIVTERMRNERLVLSFIIWYHR